MISTDISILISVVALSVSVLTAWFTLFRKGELKITNPNLIVFGRDKSVRLRGNPILKVYLRTLLFSTSRRGQVVESLHLILATASHKERCMRFLLWAYGEERLTRGSGLHVGFEGFTSTHHFSQPTGEDTYFPQGVYHIFIYAKVLNSDSIVHRFEQLSHICVTISEEHAKALLDENTELYFDWLPDFDSYFPHIELLGTKTPDSGLST